VKTELVNITRNGLNTLLPFLTGDTFCYFSGMTLAVVAILGHFSKTLLLFFIPQVGNFVYSLPQLFHLVPCPRHRLPKYDPNTDTVSMSMSEFKSSDLRFLGRLALSVLSLFRLVHLRRFVKDGEEWIECNNLTIINFALKLFGPMHERNLTVLLLCLQAACSAAAFVIRYPLALYFYGVIIA
jgi:UDP-N-acetylglucosamine--dolichyl-phosphate N-acetylglucosaminephosphotransferase